MKILRLFISLAASLFLTIIIYLIDIHFTDRHRVESIRSWGQHLSSQIEGMILKAREQRIQDPLSWALDFLNQGTEPRVFRIKKIQPLSEEEIVLFDKDQHIFHYSRVIDEEGEKWIQIDFPADYIGFLGTRNLWSNDFMLAICFVLSWCVVLWFFSFFDARSLHTERLFLQLGKQFRVLVKNFYHFLNSISNHLRLIRKIDLDLHDGSQWCQKLADELERIELNLKRLEAMSVGLMVDPSLSSLIQDIHRQTQNQIHFIAAIEKKLHACISEVQELLLATQNIERSFQGSREVISRQVSIIRELRTLAMK